MIQRSSDTAYQIAGIKNLRMVNCYRLFDESDVLSGAMAYYEDKVINLCSADDHYDELLQKIALQYAKEAPSGRIVADEETVRVLTLAAETAGGRFTQRLSAFKEISTPLFLPKAFSHFYILPFVRYIIESLYGGREDSISFDEQDRDWFGQGILSAQSRQSRLHFPYRILQKDDNRYEVIVCNVLKSGDMMKLALNFGRERITACFTEDAYFYNGELSLEFSESSASLTVAVKEADKNLITDQYECPWAEGIRPTKRTMELTAGADAAWRAYTLPWGAVIHAASDGTNEYRILSTDGGGRELSRAEVFRNVSADKEPKILFGRYAFILYEQGDKAELHMLDMPYPGQCDYARDYAGKIFEEG